MLISADKTPTKHLSAKYVVCDMLCAKIEIKMSIPAMSNQAGFLLSVNTVARRDRPQTE
jgi:hypothetical protein